MKKSALFLILSVMVLGIFVLIQRRKNDVISRNVSARGTSTISLPISTTPRFYISPTASVGEGSGNSANGTGSSSTTGDTNNTSQQSIFLSVYSPADNSEVTSPNIVVKGKTQA